MIDCSSALHRLVVGGFGIWLATRTAAGAQISEEATARKMVLRMMWCSCCGLEIGTEIKPSLSVLEANLALVR